MEENIDYVEESPEEREVRLNKVLQTAGVSGLDEQNVDLDYYHARIYVRNMKWYRKCKSAVAFQLLMYMMEHVSPRTGRVLFPASRRQDFVRRCDVSNQSVTNALKGLRDTGAIFPYMEEIPGPNGEKTGEVLCPSGEYWLNPKMIWLGSESARRHAYLQIREFYPNV